MAVLRYKDRQPDAIRYGALEVLHFPLVALAARDLNTVIKGRVALPFNFKIQAVSALLSGSVAGKTSLNIVVGVGGYGAQGSQTFTVGGTPTTGDTATATINGTAVSAGTITTGQTAAQVATALAAAIEADPVAGLIVSAQASGAVVTVKALSGGTGGNAITTTAAATGGHTTLVAGGATLAGGAAITVGTPDNRLVGIVPPTVAAAGTALFDTDRPLTMTADTVTTLYPGSAADNPANADAFDIIFPANSVISLRLPSDNAATGNAQVYLAICPVDIYYQLPDTFHPYSPSATML